MTVSDVLARGSGGASVDGDFNVEDRGLHTRGRGNAEFSGLTAAQQEMLLDRTGIPESVRGEFNFIRRIDRENGGEDGVLFYVKNEITGLYEIYVGVVGDRKINVLSVDAKGREPDVEALRSADGFGSVAYAAKIQLRLLNADTNMELRAMESGGGEEVTFQPAAIPALTTTVDGVEYGQAKVLTIMRSTSPRDNQNGPLAPDFVLYQVQKREKGKDGNWKITHVLRAQSLHADTRKVVDVKIMEQRGEFKKEQFGAREELMWAKVASSVSLLNSPENKLEVPFDLSQVEWGDLEAFNDGVFEGAIKVVTAKPRLLERGVREVGEFAYKVWSLFVDPEGTDEALPFNWNAVEAKSAESAIATIEHALTVNLIDQDKKDTVAYTAGSFLGRFITRSVSTTQTEKATTAIEKTPPGQLVREVEAIPEVALVEIARRNPQVTEAIHNKLTTTGVDPAQIQRLYDSMEQAGITPTLNPTGDAINSINTLAMEGAGEGQRRPRVGPGPGRNELKLATNPDGVFGGVETRQGLQEKLAEIESNPGRFLQLSVGGTRGSISKSVFIDTQSTVVNPTTGQAVNTIVAVGKMDHNEFLGMVAASRLIGKDGRSIGPEVFVERSVYFPSTNGSNIGSGGVVMLPGPGMPLVELINAGAIIPGHGMDLSRNLADKLAALHMLGLRYHGDLHAGNILVDGTNITLIDFGLSGQIFKDPLDDGIGSDITGGYGIHYLLNHQGDWRQTFQEFKAMYFEALEENYNIKFPNVADRNKESNRRMYESVVNRANNVFDFWEGVEERHHRRLPNN